MINKIKHDLEQWREIILHIDSVLKWEKKFYPAIIFGVNSILFLMIWYLDFSILTMAALTGFFVAQMDYVYPFVSKILFKPNNWTGVQEKKYEEICSELCLMQCKLCSIYSHMFSAKEEKSTMVCSLNIVRNEKKNDFNFVFLIYLLSFTSEPVSV